MTLTSNERIATVLCIDHDATGRALIEAIVRHRDGARFLGAETGAQGLALVRRSPPNVVVVDLDHSESAGFEVLAALRADRRTERVPVIGLTASSPLREQALDAFDAIVNKPMDDIPSFVALIDRCLRGDEVTRPSPA